MQQALSRRNLLLLTAVAGCTSPPPPAPLVSAPLSITPPLPFDQALLRASNTLLSTTPTPVTPQIVVIDPLIDGMTGEQSTATQQIGARLAALAREHYSQFSIEDFSPDAIQAQPYVMIGTFTPVDAQNQTSGDRNEFRFCLVMVDLKTGKVVGKTRVFVQSDGVNTTPLGFFQDSPVWTADPHNKSYINTCQNIKVGDPVDPVYLDGILAASNIAEATQAYADQRYSDALALYTTARATAAGDQLRVHNGLYLTNLALGRRDQAVVAFADNVRYGFDRGVLGVKFLFDTGSSVLSNANPMYGVWIEQIARRLAESNKCLQVVGNTSKTGSPALNQRISELRAQYIKERLLEGEPSLSPSRIIAIGAGSDGNLIGTGKNDATDALDRRVDFKLTACTATA